MKPIDHPMLHLDCPEGPPGELRAHIHRSCPDHGITFQCPICLDISTYSWDSIDATNTHLADNPNEAIFLPPCPSGHVTQFCHNDVYYGLDLPEYATMRAIREHVATRPAFAGLRRFKASMHDGRYQGSDFSNLAPSKRPPQHHDPAE